MRDEGSKLRTPQWVFSSEKRRTVLGELIRRRGTPTCANEIAAVLAVPHREITYHLMCLAEAGAAPASGLPSNGSGPAQKTYEIDPNWLDSPAVQNELKRWFRPEA